MAGIYRNLYYGLNKYVFSVLPDSLYHNLLSWIMHRRFGAKFYWLNVKNPQTFSEKLQWLKKHGDMKLKTRLADKFDVRDWIAGKVGEQYLVELLPLNKRGDYYVESVDDLDFNCLPERFALKLTKGSGYNIICKDKGSLDIEVIKSQVSKWLKVENYYLSREPQYIGHNKLICEVLLEYNIKDYKFFCFNGVPKYLKVDFGRYTEHHANYYDMDWNLLDINELCCTRDPETKLECPAQFEEMKEVARKLAEGFPFVRVDLYIHDEKVYFGEMTFIPAGGYAPISPREWEYKSGEMINLE